jgi:hypothetical protein
VLVLVITASVCMLSTSTSVAKLFSACGMFLVEKCCFHCQTCCVAWLCSSLISHKG